MTDTVAPGGLGLRWNAVCLDCADAEEMAAFYGQLLGWKVPTAGGRWIPMPDPAGGVGLIFQARDWYQPPTWPESADAQHKMMHFEIKVNDVEAAARHAIASGATVAAHQPQNRDPAKLRVMLDPAGHPFCLWAE